MAVITISHQMGAGGPEIGMKLGQKLGYRYVDQELVLDVARRYGVAEDKLSHLDESKPTLFERFDIEGSVLQEYIPGDGYGFFALFEHGKERAIFMHRRIREYPITGSSWICRPTPWPRPCGKYSPYPASTTTVRAAASTSRQSTPGARASRPAFWAANTRS